MPTMDDDEKLIAALRSYKQADADGVMCVVSRQAVHEAADRLSALKAERDRLREELDSLHRAVAGISLACRRTDSPAHAIVRMVGAEAHAAAQRCTDFLRARAALSGAEAMTHTPDEVLDSTPSARLHACLVACAGIPTDKLRPGIVRELIAAARLAHGVVPAGGDGTYKYVDAAPLRALLRELGSE